MGQKIEKILCFRITWKHIVLGFYDENNSITRKVNNFKYFVCYDIYNYKMKCRFEEKHMSKENLIKKLKHSILTQKDVLIYINAHQDSKLYFDVGNLL